MPFQVFVFFMVLTIVLWLVVGALINPKALGPYAMMVLSLGGLGSALYATLAELQRTALRMLEEMMLPLLSERLEEFIRSRDRVELILKCLNVFDLTELPTELKSTDRRIY